MIKHVLIIGFLAVLLGLGARVVQEQPVPFWGHPEPIKLIEPKGAIASSSSLVSPDEAFTPADQPYAIDYPAAMGLYSKRKRDNIHFVDSREPELYVAGHIPGALNVPYEELADYLDTLNTIPKNELIVFYCDGGDCHLSHDIAEIALSQGWRRVCVYVGGWEEWCLESDFVAKGKAVMGDEQ
jgi:rhodanese-related sulfurtransferase